MDYAMNTTQESNAYGQTASAVPMTEIASEFEMLEKAISRLGMQREILSNRIQMVCRNNPPQPTKPGVIAGVPSTAFGSALAEARRRIDSITEQIDADLNALAL